MDPGATTPYGAWMRPSGPIRRLGSTSVVVRPTYIWRGSSGSEGLGLARRGANIFGDFRRTVSWPEAAVGVVPAAEPSWPERLLEEPNRFVEQHGKEKAITGKRLLDEDSGSFGPNCLASSGIGLRLKQQPGIHINLAHSPSADSVGSSFGPIASYPKTGNDPSQVVKPTFLSAVFHRDFLQSFPGCLASEVGGGGLSHRPLSPQQSHSPPAAAEPQALGVTAGFSSLLVDVPLASNFRL
ncbi:hypothetical protein Salat_2531100 [Sesamum alatum]|uniref:Uncharacterized protein n=1 Tax=Sesamum alatum TaxID=300844 RepID=A0AAE1XSC0_9LAMI|nr:hypothetical protein Salat_2531100 [Sesamum alatum]